MHSGFSPELEDLQELRDLDRHRDYGHEGPHTADVCCTTVHYDCCFGCLPLVSEPNLLLGTDCKMILLI